MFGVMLMRSVKENVWWNDTVKKTMNDKKWALENDFWEMREKDERKLLYNVYIETKIVART